MIQLNAETITDETDIGQPLPEKEQEQAEEQEPDQEEQQEGAVEAEVQVETEATDAQPAVESPVVVSPLGTIFPRKVAEMYNEQTAAANDEAQSWFDSRVDELAREMATIQVEISRGKARVKEFQDTLKNLTEQLDGVMARGPVAMPLFDAAKLIDVIEATSPATPTPTTPPPAPAELPPDARERVRVYLHRTIEAEEIEFGVVGTVCEAFVNEENDVFLSKFLLPEDRASDNDDGWRYAYLEDGEYDLQEDEPTDDQQHQAEEADQTAWRVTLIADLKGLTPKIVEVLDGHNVRTVGDWLDLPLRHGGGDFRYTALKGVTEARYDKIVEAMRRATA